MFQFIGVMAVALFLGFFAQMPIVGSLILWGVVWLSTESFFGGMFIAAVGTAAFILGYIPMLYIAIAVGIWTLLAWGFKN
jgi:hypothetical protein